MKKRLRTGLLFLASLSACAPHTAPPPSKAPVATAPFSPANPFAQKSALPFEAPPFDKIHDGDYAPAIEEGMRRELAEIAAIVDNPAPPDFANTIVPMERSGALLTRASKVFFDIAQTDTNATLQKVKADIAPKLAAHHDAISLNPKLFARVQAVYDKREGLAPEEKYLVER